MGAITLAQQNGGPDVNESFNKDVLVLRKLLAHLRIEDYTNATPEFALILRVDGSLTKFGTEGVETPKVRRNYVQVDIVVQETRWTCSPAERRTFLAEVVGEALMAITDTLTQKGRAVNRDKLASDYLATREAFLNAARE